MPQNVEQLVAIMVPHPDLPRHPTGKLYKRLVRDRYWGKSDSTIV